MRTRTPDRRPNARARQKGIASLMTVIFLLVVIGFAGVTLLRMSASDLTDSTAQNDSVAALFLAESALERASRLLASGTACGAGLMEGQIALARGTFQLVNPVPSVVSGRCQVTASGRVNATTRSVQAGINHGIVPIAASNGNANGSFAFQHNIPANSGTSRALLVGVALRNDASPVVAVTYAGQPLARVAQAANPGNARVELWALANPPTGNNPVAVTLAAATRVVGGAMSFSGVDQALPWEAAASATGNSAAPTLSITTLSSRAYVVDALATRTPNPNPNVVAGQTRLWAVQTAGGAGNAVTGAGSRRGPLATPGATTMTWTGAAQPWALVAVALRPVPVAVATWREL